MTKRLRSENDDEGGIEEFKMAVESDEMTSLPNYRNELIPPRRIIGFGNPLRKSAPTKLEYWQVCRSHRPH